MAEEDRSGILPVSRALHLLLVAVIGLAFVGLVVGMRQGTTIPELSRPPRGGMSDPEAIAATAYRDFDRRTHGPNCEWHSGLETLQQPAADLWPGSQDGSEPVDGDQRQVSQQQRRQDLAARAQRRAFEGAPPVVPHSIDQMSTTSCMSCHGPGLQVGKGVRAPQMSHPFLANCTQCHVEGSSPHLDPMTLADNTFTGRPAAGPGQRAWEGAPPTVPHSIFMRENCLSCHGPAGAESIRTTHPWRTNCLQCHAPSAVLDQIAPTEEPLWLDSLELLSP